MKMMKRVLAGALSFLLGIAAIYLAVAFYRTAQDLTPITGRLHAHDFAFFLALGVEGVAFLVIAYVFFFRSAKA
jgi:hypothetical protein